MSRTLPGVVGIVLALAAVVGSPKASAQILGRLRRQQIPAQKGVYEIDAILSDERQRLAEMKVELALLSDIATFPYDFTARANGKALELRGNVPNEMVRQRAMDQARSSTFLRGIDALRVQPNLSVRSSLRAPNIVQQEGMELLLKELGAPAKQMSLEARPNGVVMLRGQIDCVESKLEISRLFRRLPGCTAVVNELTVEPIVLDGHRVVRVTHNNMLLVPPAALGQVAEPPPESSPPVVPVKSAPPSAIIRQSIISPQPQQAVPAAPLRSNSLNLHDGELRSPQPQPTAPAAVPLRSSSLNARDGELRLPTATALNRTNNSSKTAPEKIGDDWEAFAPSKLPVKWSRPTGNLETQTKDLEAANSRPTSSTAPRSQQTATAQPLPKPAKLTWTPQSSPRSQDEMPVPIRMVDRPTEPKKGQAATTTAKPSRAIANARPNFAEAHEAPPSGMTWRRPGGSEEAEPKSSVPAKEEKVDAVKLPPLPPPTPIYSSPRSSRRWPAAYVTGTPSSQGKAGVIAFDDDPPPPPAKPAPDVIARSRSLAPADLQRQLKSLCGRQAREVVATVQKDGIILVRVKVANRSIEDQLSRKILALPEMTSPKVRLMMEIEP